MKNRIKCSLISVVLAGLAAAALAQSNIYVATNGVDDGAAGRGQSWASPYATISNGIAKAPTAGDTVWVSNGAYILSAQLSIANAITVSAWSASAADTIIDGGYPARTGRCVNISAAATLSRFTITNGYVVGSQGAGVNMSAGTVTGCVIVNNTLNYTNNDPNGYGGGGVYMTAGTVRDSEIRDNRALDSAGGGVCNRGGTLMSCTVMGNTATNGGGVYMNSGTVQDCTIKENRANDIDGYPGGGGGVMVYNSGTVRGCLIERNTNATGYSGQGGGMNLAGSAAVLVSNCTISGNQSGYGGGVSLWNSARIVDSVISNNLTVGSSPRGGGVSINLYGILDRCTIVGNRCSERGAGVYCDRGGIIRNCLIIGNSNSAAYGGGLMLENTKSYGGYMSACTIVSNYAASGGGRSGIYINDWDYGTTPTNCFITNCVVYFNTGGNVYPTTAAVLSNYWYCSTTEALPANQGNITPSDPLFVDRNAGNYRLTKDSPCVNAGTNDAWMANSIDRDMRMRIRYGRVDMGAYEVIYSGSIFTMH